MATGYEVEMYHNIGVAAKALAGIEKHLGALLPTEPSRTDSEGVAVPTTPQGKLDMLKAMGFTAHGDDHAPDCSSLFASGYRCNCVPDPTCWFAPDDVMALMHETWHERAAKARKRQAREDD